MKDQEACISVRYVLPFSQGQTIPWLAVRVSSGSTSFEEITLAHRFSDGDYKVDIDYSSGEEAVDFSVFVNPLSGEGQNFEATGSFSREQAGNMVLSSFLTINKTDSMYTISRN